MATAPQGRARPGKNSNTASPARTESSGSVHPPPATTEHRGQRGCDHGPAGALSWALPFGGASCGIAASFPSRNRCRPSPCAGLSPARSTTAAPPRPARSAVGAPIPASGPDARRREPSPGGSRVHCDSLDEVGARLCPCGIAAGTPQTFPAASLAACANRRGSSPARNEGRVRTASSPDPSGSSWRLIKGVSHTGSSRTPFRPARRTRPI
jgi:hypothetical protein